MQRFIAVRVLQSLVAILVMSLIVFGLARLSGNPLDVMLPIEAEAEDYDRLSKLEADRAMLEHLRAGNYHAWRDTPLAQMEAAGQQEVLNWTCLAGAMAELDYKADILDWVETWTFNAPKCMAVFRAA